MAILNSPLSAAKALIQRHEGLRLQVYKDTTGHFTIGYGREISNRGISPAEAEHLLANDIVYFYGQLTQRLPFFAGLDDVRQLALVDMAFNLGVDGLLRFGRMVKALSRKDFTMAAVEALDSLWHEQVGKRAREIAYMLQFGEMPAL